MKISTRITILISILSILLIGLGAIGILGIEKSNDALKTVYEDRVVALSRGSRLSNA